MRFFLLILTLFNYLLTYSQPGVIQDTKYFDIKLAGVKIGELKATRTIKDTITVYLLESNVSFCLFVSVEAHHKAEAIYYGDKLFSSTSTSETSKGNFASSVVWKRNHYEVNVDSYKYNNAHPIYEALDCSVARFYFDEPIRTQKTLADAYGVLATVKKMRSGCYEVTGMGMKNKYFYEKGSFVRANMYSKIKNYDVVLRK